MGVTRNCNAVYAVVAAWAFFHACYPLPIFADSAPSSESKPRDLENSPQPYVDKLISGEPAEDASLEETILRQQESPGFYDIATIAQHYTLTRSGVENDESASSISTYATKQTANFGSIYSEVHLTRFSSLDFSDIYFDQSDDIQADSELHGAFTIRQMDFALTENLLAENVLGVQRIRTGWTYGNPSGLTLPSPTIAGAATYLEADKHAIRLMGGRIGRLRGPLDQAFFDEDANMLLAGDTYSLNEQWALSGDIWSTFSSPDATENRTGYSLLARRRNRDSLVTDRYFQIIGDNEVDTPGFAAYLVEYAGRFTHRIGAYSLPEGLSWMTRDVPDDAYGAYYRGSYERGTMRFNGGVETQRLFLRRNDDRTPRDALLLNLGWNNRLSYSSTIGVNGYYRTYKTADDDQDTGNSFSSRIFYGLRHTPRLSSRWEISWLRDDLYADNEPVVTDTLKYVFTNNLTESSEYSLEIGADHRRSEYDDAWSPEFGISGQTPLPYGGWLQGSVFYSMFNSDQSRDQNNWHAQLQAEMPVGRNWRVGAQLTYNQVILASDETLGDSGLFTEEEEETSNSVLLSVRHQAAGGSPIYPLGRKAGENAGSGSVRGAIFYDENGDGVRQASEKMASGVELFLDGRYLAKTNQQGEFRFPLVATGDHFVYIAEETVLLPWEVKDLTPSFKVKLRKTARLQIPLVKIN